VFARKRERERQKRVGEREKREGEREREEIVGESYREREKE
jgi:hypothetical protein